MNLFTRPRRFGKSLNMSMLESFFSPQGEKSIFDKLDISKETVLCEEYMGKYPVISISLKGIDARSYETAYQMAVQVIIDVAAKFYFLLDSENLNAHDKAEYRDIFVTQIMEFFKDNVREDGETLNRFCAALQNGDVTGVEMILKYGIACYKKHCKVMLSMS